MFNKIRNGFVILILSTLNLFAQKTHFYQAEEDIFRQALDAFEDESYSNSIFFFEKYLNIGKNVDKRIESTYYIIICKKFMENSAFELELLYFIETYPSHPKSKEAYIVLGNYYYEQGNYEQVIVYLKTLDILSIKSEFQAKNVYRLGHAYFINKDYSKAKPLLNLVSTLPYHYTAEASYYLGYIYWKEDNYEEALLNLTFARNHLKEYASSIDEIILDTYYQIQQYDSVISYTEFIEKKTDILTQNMYLLVGEAYFIKGDYEKAIKNLQQYVLQIDPNVINRQVWYRLGYANFKVKNFKEAIDYLRRVADGEDELAQNVSYLLGIIYLNQRQKQAALAAFDKTRSLNFDKNIQKKSAFYFIKVSYDLGNYSNTINEGYSYLGDYQFRNQEIQFFITNSYLNTGDYAKALEYLRTIKEKNEDLKAAYQTIAFNKATQDYQDGYYHEALDIFKESLAFPIDKNLVNLSYYWMGEIHLLYNQSKLALEMYEKINHLSSVYDNAQYGIAYSYYYQEMYDKAQEYFYNFINANNVLKENKIDAWIRLGDCYFIQKNMNNALLAYQEAIEDKTINYNYVYFQLALIHRYLKNNTFAIQYLDKIINSTEESPYIEKAYYHKGVLLFEQEDYDLTVNTYSIFIQLYSKSILLPHIYSKRGLAYNLVQANTLAVKDYKTIIDKYPEHRLAANAVQSLQEISNNGHYVSDLDIYIQKFKNANPESTATLAGDFLKAKKPFEKGDYLTAIYELRRFITDYNFNNYFNEAYYKLGYALEKSDSFEQAIIYYNLVKSNYKIRAVRNTAALHYQSGNYTDAINKYLELKSISLTNRYLYQAIEGLMKSYYQVGNYLESKTYINWIIDKKLSRYLNEAFLYQGKIYLAQKYFDESILNFQKIIEVNQGVQGAEAQYLIGKAYREKGDYVQSTQAFIDVKNNYEGYLAWIYKSYLLIAENYIDVDEIFQAKATLKSIYDNSQDLAIKTQAKQRLEELQENVSINQVNDTLKE